MVHSYRELIVWQKAVELVTEVYRLTEKFPKEEVYGISAQMRRAALSIPSNIAEGRRRGTRKDFKNFLNIAFGSGAELETQVEIAKRLSLANPSDFRKTEGLLDEIMRMLNRMTVKLQANKLIS